MKVVYFLCVNKLEVSDIRYNFAVCFTRTVKSAFEGGTSEGFYTTQLFGIVTQGPITKPLAAIQRSKIPLQFVSMAKAAWEPGN